MPADEVSMVTPGIVLIFLRMIWKLDMLIEPVTKHMSSLTLV